MKERAPRNKTLTLTEEERNSLRPRLLSDHQLKRNTNLINRTIHGDVLSLLSQFPAQMADLIIVDPPYNLSKNFNGFQFKATTESQYLEYLRSWFPQLCKLLKSNGSLYLCGDWKSTSALQQVMEENLTVMTASPGSERRAGELPEIGRTAWRISGTESLIRIIIILI